MLALPSKNLMNRRSLLSYDLAGDHCFELNAGLSSAGETMAIDTIDCMEPPVQGTETVPVFVSTTASVVAYVVTGSMALTVTAASSSVSNINCPLVSLHKPDLLFDRCLVPIEVAQWIRDYW